MSGLHGQIARAATLGAMAVLALAPGGAAHVQVTPALVAPADSVRFAVLVPGERAPARTVRIDLKVPDGVLPYAFAETPGWTRENVERSDGSIDRIVWTGDLPPDGFAEFAFLAGTPDAPGTIAWKALQTYDDGTVVRWIEGPDGELPAATTRVDPTAPRMADGDGGAAAPTSAPAASTIAGDASAAGTSEPAPSAPAPVAPVTVTVEAPAVARAVDPAASSSSAGGADHLARWAAFTALGAVVMLGAIGVLFRGPRERDP